MSAVTLTIALDDTDTRESRGAGRLARASARDLLAARYHFSGMSRHKLLVHPGIPFFVDNGCGVIHVENNAGAVLSLTGSGKTRET